jgi:Domain of unknown function (DUF4157)
MLSQRQLRTLLTPPFTPVQTGILQRKCACGNHTVAGGECAECRKKREGMLQRAATSAAPVNGVPSIVHDALRSPRQLPDAATRAFIEPRFGRDFSRIPTRSPAVGAIQTKLAINKPGDEYEQEADRIADQVLAAPAHTGISGAPPRIQRFAGQASAQDAAPASVDRVLASSGRPLDPALQQDMGQRFGYDFSRVRVHSGAVAEQSAREVNAHAYTMGHNIVFGAGQFVPGTHEGRRLIAHELTHVVQQSGSDAQDFTLRRADREAVNRTISLGSVVGSGIKFFPTNVVATVVGAIDKGQPLITKTQGSVRIARQADAGAPDAGTSDINRGLQVECVKRLGGCPNTRPGGIPTSEEVARYNDECRRETGYADTDVTPTDEECQHAPVEERPQAQVCARPLHYPALSLVFNHAYVAAPPDRYAIIAPLCKPTDGGSDSLVWGGTAARKWDNSPDPCGDEPQCVPCRPKRGVSDVKQCLRNAFDAYNSPVLHKALGPNSNTFAGTLARTCCDGIGISPFFGFTPGWDDPPAPTRSATCPAGSPTCS